MNLPEPGEICIYDYRVSKKRRCKASSESFLADRMPMLKCVQWNIERGYKLNQVIEILRRHQADIIFLQELDIGCDRTECVNVPEIIAEALKMKCVFVTEFVEFRSPVRKARIQGGGVHGNAILSHFDLDPFIIGHSRHPLDWEKFGHKIYEPRRGERIILGANVNIPGLKYPIRCYSLHLEVFCGIFGRLRQFSDVMRDVKEHLKDHPYQFIFGDLNTMAHGIARFSPLYCSDKLRVLSIGFSEAQWWQRYLFDKCQESGINQALLRHVPHQLSKEDAENLINPYFYDPFCQSKDTTLHNVFGMFRGKLDWALIRGMYVLAKGMDNHNFKASDHKLLYVVVRPVDQRLSESEFKAEVIRACHEGRILINHYRNFARSIIGTIIYTLVIIALFYIVRLLIKGELDF